MDVKQIAESKLSSSLHGKKVIISSLESRLKIGDVVKNVLQSILITPIISQDIVGKIAAVKYLRVARVIQNVNSETTYRKTFRDSNCIHALSRIISKRQLRLGSLLGVEVDEETQFLSCKTPCELRVHLCKLLDLSTE